MSEYDMAESKGTNLRVMHFPDRKKPCLCIEQDDQVMIIATFKNKECEYLYHEFMGGSDRCLRREMRPIFEEECEEE